MSVKFCKKFNLNQETRENIVTFLAESIIRILLLQMTHFRSACAMMIEQLRQFIQSTEITEREK